MSVLSNLHSNYGMPGGTQVGEAVTKEFNYTAAQANVALVTAAAGERIVVERIAAMVSKAVSATEVEVRVGCAAATLPAKTTAGAADIFFSHPGLAAGSGYEVEGEPIEVGVDGEDLRLTCDVPTDGEVTVVVRYRIVVAW